MSLCSFMKTFSFPVDFLILLLNFNLVTSYPNKSSRCLLRVLETTSPTSYFAPRRELVVLQFTLSYVILMQFAFVASPGFDGCDKGFHTYCMIPPVVAIPSGMLFSSFLCVHFFSAEFSSILGIMPSLK